MGLVYMVLKRFANRGQEQEDLFQIGIIGLMKAIDKFDISRDFSFSTYAVPMIIGEIRRFLRDDGIIHVSRQVKDNARRIAIVKEELKKNQNTDPTMEDLAIATGLSMDEILMAIEATTEVESIYQPVGNQSDGSKLLLADQLEDQQTGEADLIDRITVSQMLSTLETRERRLIELRYLEGKTQTESAKELGMNQVAVSRLEKKILLFLRQQF
ncbi:MAG: sigma-70 family RNA polymerase sigma factor [Lachnospiraceae bacterium]|nr:sigma-70 family RNA polymerase sigma factor [Lachnospiraceae bacterium]